MTAPTEKENHVLKLGILADIRPRISALPWKHGGLAELVDAYDLGSYVRVRVRVPYPLPDQTRVTYGSPGILKWLRSIVVMHFLGKEETGGSSPPGASIIITMKHRCFCSVVEQKLCAMK